MKAKYNIQVKKIQCDNADDDHALEALCKKEGNCVAFEYIAPEILQQNGHVKQKIATLFGQVRSTLNRGNIIDSWRQILWAEAVNIATFIAKAGNVKSAF